MVQVDTSQLVQICQLYINDVNTLFHHITEKVYWICICGGHWGAMNSLSHSKSHFKILLQYYAGSNHLRMRYLACECGNSLQQLLRSQENVPKTIIPPPMSNCYKVWIHAFMLYTNFCPHYLNFVADIKSHQTIYYCPVLVSLYDLSPQFTVLTTRLATRVLLCCCNTSVLSLTVVFFTP